MGAGSNIPCSPNRSFVTPATLAGLTSYALSKRMISWLGMNDMYCTQWNAGNVLDPPVTLTSQAKRHAPQFGAPLDTS
jgi:hypothetical protein